MVLRNSLSVVKGFPWDVLAGSPEYDGLGYSRLTTEVTKGRLRLFQSTAVSKFATENDLGRAMTHLAQRWAGSSTPVKMMHVDDLRSVLIQPSPLQSASPPGERRHSVGVFWLRLGFLEKMNQIGRKPAHTVAELASARRHQENWPAIMKRAVGSRCAWVSW